MRVPPPVGRRRWAHGDERRVARRVGAAARSDPVTPRWPGPYPSDSSLRNGRRLVFWRMESRIRRNGPPAAHRIESVDKVLRLLWLLRDRPHLTVSEASDALGGARSTAHRLLAMLVEHRFADQEPVSRAYHPGPALLEIGLGATRNPAVRAV